VTKRYGDPDDNYDAKQAGLGRLFLHAQSIAFPDDSGNDLHFTAPLADDLEHFLNTLPRDSRQRNRRHGSK
jgi:23S rRNA pseudouridine955/2504/2580 synthase